MFTVLVVFGALFVLYVVLGLAYAVYLYVADVDDFRRINSAEISILPVVIALWPILIYKGVY